MPTSAPYIGRFASSRRPARFILVLSPPLSAAICRRAPVVANGGCALRISIHRGKCPAPPITFYASSTITVLHWDGLAIYQSQRHEAYLRVLTTLRQRGLSYYCCDFTRSRIQSLGGHYDGHCRDRRIPAEGATIRLRQTAPVLYFHDRLRGRIEADPALAREDFIIPPPRWAVRL